MSFAKKFLEKNPINLSHLYKSNDINPLQYKLLAPKYIKGGPIKIPHSYSNKYNKIQMRNTLELLHELFKNNK
tara:strand:+ start:1000 stop:1218 length:219 start_codon:yes stop_codon:yes gene_type:complete